MNCDICGKEIGEIIVSLSLKRPNGALNTLACQECAENSSCYCQKHERPHLGFEDDNTTACMLCIEELVDEKIPEEVAVFEELGKILPREEMERLVEWANDSSIVSGDPGTVCILRAIATKALRLKTTFEEIKSRIIKEKLVGFILGEWL